jgi:ABC-2 type transport system permease protein
MRSLLNILWLGIKELRSVLSDKVLILFVLYAFTFLVYSQATGTSNEVNNASIAFADEDESQLSKYLTESFYPPRFQRPVLISTREVEEAMDRGRFMFVVTIPPRFESDLHAGRRPDIQVSIDATAMQQAGIGAGYIKNILNQRISAYLQRSENAPAGPVNLVVRRLFNPNGVSSWFS